MSINTPRSVIFGVAGKTLTRAERIFFERTQPLGFILFSRNIDHPKQVQLLIHNLKSLLHHSPVPILIDQEGGRIVRLASPHWYHPPSAHIMGQLAEEDPKLASTLARDNAWLIGQDLQELGISVNCAPCIDLFFPLAHGVIGDRAYSHKAEICATLALQTIFGFLESGIVPVIKHLPGHGRAQTDSHIEPVIISAQRHILMQSDFHAFRLVQETLNQHSPPLMPWGMTAHATYTDIDSERSATHSSVLLEGIVRGNINFQGFLLSDCITMESLPGPIGTRAQRALEAGCDAVLHCNGHLDEMIEVAAHVNPMPKESMMRYHAGFSSHLESRTADRSVILRTIKESIRQLYPDFS